MTMYTAEPPIDPKSNLPAPAPQSDLDTLSIAEDQMLAPEQMPEPEAPDWLSLSRDAYEESRDYFDSSIRDKQEAAVAHFNNKHAPGSKYYTDSYKFRAKGFRPKSRSVVRRNEAAAAKAFFSTQDLVSIKAEDPSDPAQQASADIMHQIMNYRLTNTIPWFRTLIGAYQDTLVAGVCISFQDWRYNPQKQIDEPNIELRPVENVLFAPGTNWTDPMRTSPYIIDKLPMFIGDIKERIKAGEWLDVEESMLRISTEEYEDSIRQQRENNRQNSQDAAHSEQEFDNAWVHRNIIRKEGVDYLFYTLGVHAMLSEPTPLHEYYTHLAPDERPYVMGYSIMETHKTYPSSLTMLTESLQQEANDISNQRRDNVSLVLNRRYYVRRGAGIDMKSLTRNVPGSVTLMGDIDNDIRTEAPPEVTGSAFQEQDRVNMDYDELAGSFSPGSVGSNRALSETVGGMDMMQGDANEIMEYQLRVFAETWVERTLKQVIKMEQAYETDEAILMLAGRNAQMMQKYGIDQVTDRMLQGSMTIDLNVGFGATNPQKRIEKMSLALRSIAEFAPHIIKELDAGETVTEVMGALGFKDGKRFFPNLGKEDQDPKVKELEKKVQELTQQLETGLHLKQEDYKRATDVEKIRAQKDLQIEQLKAEVKQAEIGSKSELEMTKAQMKSEIDKLGKQIEHSKSEIERGKLINARDMLLWKMELEGANFKQQSMDMTQPESMPNPDNRQSVTIGNDDYGYIPGQQG